MRILGLLLVLGASTAMSESMGDLINVFESQLVERGIEFQSLDDGRYEIVTDDGQMTVALDNLSRQYARDQDAEAVSRFLDSVLSGLAPLPDWENARRNVFPMIESTEVEIGDDTITRSLSDEVRLIPVHFNEVAGRLRFLHQSDAENWGITLNELWEAAETSLDSIMQGTEVTYLDANGFQLGVIQAHEPHKASLIRAQSLRSKVESELGWPIFAVAPSRGFVFLISKSDADELGRVGASVVKEFKAAEYPISTEVWEVSDAGIEAIGAFPTD